MDADDRDVVGHDIVQFTSDAQPFLSDRLIAERLALGGDGLGLIGQELLLTGVAPRRLSAEDGAAEIEDIDEDR